MVFLLFAHALATPRGGAADCVGIYETVEQAEQAAVDGEVCEIAENRDGRLVVIRERDGGVWRDCGPLPVLPDRLPSI